MVGQLEKVTLGKKGYKVSMLEESRKTDSEFTKANFLGKYNFPE